MIQFAKRLLVGWFSLFLGGCVSTYGPVTVSRTLNIGVVHNCDSLGVGVQLCDRISFDPKTCALIIVYPKPPTLGLQSKLTQLAHLVKAECMTEGIK